MYKSKYTGVQVDSMLESIASKQPKLTAGNGITINGNTISVDLDISLFKVVSSLPTTGIESNKIYLVASGTTGSQNIYTEYLWVNNKWEVLGQYKAEVDLSNYVTNRTLTILNNDLTSKINTNISNISSLNARVNALDADPNYELVLFKKS